MNGAKIPNWAKLIVLGVGAGWVAAMAWSASAHTQTTLSEKLEAQSAVMAKLAAAVESKAEVDRSNLQVVHARLAGLERRVDEIAVRIDYRAQQTRNAVDQVEEKVDDAAAALRKSGKR